MDSIATLLGRRSPGKITEPGPDARQLETILDAAVRAPDHGRLAPWRFAVLQGTSRAILAEALAGALLRRQPDADAAMLAAEKAKAFRAPVIIAVAARTVPGHKVPEIEQVVAVGAAIQNMLLAAHALGFGSAWKTGLAAYDSTVRTALGFEARDQIVGFVYLGSVAAPPKPREFHRDSLVRYL